MRATIRLRRHSSGCSALRSSQTQAARFTPIPVQRSSWSNAERLTVQVGGAARLTLADDQPGEGTPTAGELAPVDSEFEMTAGDQLVYLPQTPMTFRNAGSETVSLLTVVLLPAGHQHPPGVTYINGQPNAEAFAGVTPQILGDGVASSMPANGIRIVVDQLSISTRALPFRRRRIRRCCRSSKADSTSPSSAARCRFLAEPHLDRNPIPRRELKPIWPQNDAIYRSLGNEGSRRARNGRADLLPAPDDLAGQSRKTSRPHRVKAWERFR